MNGRRWKCRKLSLIPSFRMTDLSLKYFPVEWSSCHRWDEPFTGGSLTHPNSPHGDSYSQGRLTRLSHPRHSIEMYLGFLVSLISMSILSL